ncbi:MFS transporter [Swingsia samuiensis]|uniref:MFS transporter n=2 Tax=Swingsia samuiensis TaxID=1293412 RepID=A0A4Y6UMH7_9PROT|nr:MFS transporter [Swingsia samuiensis]
MTHHFSSPALDTLAPVKKVTQGAGQEEVTITIEDLRRAAWAASVGSAIEYYDFALYSLASALIFGPLFFSGTSPTVGLVASFATYFIGFAVRPIGGIIFGRLGDRLGRKTVLLLTISLMGLGSAGIGLIPTYASIGIAAPLLLIVLRIVQGLGAGAEQAGAAVMMTEMAPSSRRGFFASLPFLGIQLGTIVASSLYFAMLEWIPNVAHTWLWRLPFLVSIILLAMALYMRLHLKETPAFKKAREEADHHEHEPLRDVLMSSRHPIFAGIGLRIAENGGSSLYQVLAISYLVHTIGMSPLWGTASLICAACVGAITIPVAGRLSDRYGRVKVYRSFAILQALTAIPVWYIFSYGNIVLSMISLSLALGVATWGMFGTQAAFLPEMFGSRNRYTAVSFTREFSAVISGGVAPMIGQYIIGLFAFYHIGHATTGIYAWIPLALYVVGISSMAVLATFYIPETKGRDLLSPKDAF